VLLGDRILAAVRALGPGTSDVAMTYADTIVGTSRKDGLAWPDELARYAGSEERPLVRLPIRFLRINETVLWSAPVEMFCEIAMNVRDKSPFPHTFYFGYTNGWFGYLPTARAFDEGGYEPRTSPFTARAEVDVSEAVVAVIHGFKR
jgi:hypothetical protein